MKKDLLRIIDANLNRSREGLRVCEEVVRFILEDKKLTEELKRLRHKISRSVNKFPAIPKGLLDSRQTITDVGRKISNRSGHKHYKDIFSANIQRVKESLRVLEEFAKIFNRALSNNFARLRFKAYELEKKIIARL